MSEALATTRGRIDVWLIQADGWPDADRRAAWAVLADDERVHARGLPAALGRRFTVSRGTVRALLGRYLGTAPAHVALMADPSGKPSARDRADVRFNVSHAKGLTALAVTAHDDVGIDIERVVSFGGVLRLASSICTPAELARLRAADASGRRGLLYQWWVRKEASAKAVGTGLRSPFSEIHVDARGVRMTESVALEVGVPTPEGARAVVWAADLQPSLGFRGAVASTRPGGQVRMRSDRAARALLRGAAAQADR